MERQILEDCYRYNEPIPDVIKDAPELMLGLQYYLDAWFELNDSRQIGMGLGPIPWVAVRTYGMDDELDEEEMMFLKNHIRALDTTFLEFKNKGNQNGSV